MSKAATLGVLFLGLWAGSIGCELITTVDRSEISGAGGTGGLPTTSSASSSGGTGGASTTSSTGVGGAGGSGGATASSSSSSASGTGGTGGATSSASSSASGTGGSMCSPVDDSNPCTDDLCENGVPVNKPTAAGSVCSVGGTLCDGKGACVACLAATDCPGTDGACQTRTCAQGQCGIDFAAAGTALPTQTAGDCKQAVCDGAGATTVANDNTDVPDDSNACTDDVCTAGVPSNVNKATGAVCGAGLVCDAAGACVGCNAPSDCPGSDDECKARTCTAGQCGVAFTAAGTPVIAQTTGNCLKATCDGSGNVADVADATDLPADDGNPCTDEACTLGAPSHPAKANGASCTDGDACTVGDTCQAGTCTSGAPLTCAAQDQCHSAGTCNPATGVCSTPSKADGSACNDGNACTQADTCQAGSCSGASPVTCAAQDQCHAAGTCNPATGACSNPSLVNGSACDDGNACTQADTCQAGTCSGASPVTCTAQDQCHSAGTCNPATGACSNPNRADGSACNDGNACTQADTCQAGACSGANPVACAAQDQCHAAGTCNPATGACSNPSLADGSACNDGNACTQTDTCQAGSCSGANPVTCAALDQCHVAGTCNAGTGACSNPAAPAGTPVATQTAGDCQANACDGAGNVAGVADNADVPADDGNQCTSEVCTAGVPSHPSLPAGTACNQGGGSACNGAGACVAAPAIAITSPADGAAPQAGSTIAVTFTLAMNPTTLTGQTGAGACSGSIQVSLDNFASCIAFSTAAATMSGGNTVATLTAAPGLLVNRSYKIRVTAAAASASGTVLAAQYTQATGFTTTSPNLCEGSVVMSQVYSGGGAAAATYKNDFVELHNRGTTAVSLAGTSLQYASTGGTSWSAALLSGTIPAGGYFLVQLGGNLGLASLPTPDATPSNALSLAAAAGKIAFVNSTAAIANGNACPPAATLIDFVGYGGTTTCSEGNVVAPAMSTTIADIRNQAGCGDIGVNGTDFTTGAPTPRNSAAAPTACACVVNNESNAATEADYGNVQSPLSLSVQTGVTTGSIYGQLYELGTTEAAGADANVRAQLGYGPATANPEYEAGWTWINATYNVQVGNNDEYQASFLAPAVGSYRYVYRYSFNQGVSWTYADGNGAGSNAGLSFDFADESVLTVTP